MSAVIPTIIATVCPAFLAAFTAANLAAIIEALNSTDLKSIATASHGPYGSAFKFAIIATKPCAIAKPF